jgi:hypothetical protein
MSSFEQAALMERVYEDVMEEVQSEAPELMDVFLEEASLMSNGDPDALDECFEALLEAEIDKRVEQRLEQMAQDDYDAWHTHDDNLLDARFAS